MDLWKIIQDLRSEKERLDVAIQSLEALLSAGADQLLPTRGRRGRKKGMSPEERQKVSQRMKEYWAKRRAEKASAAGSAS